MTVHRVDDRAFLDDTVPTSLLNIDGYFFERYDRGSRHGGGVGFYIRDSIQYEMFKNDIVIKQGIEALFIEVKLSNRKPIILGSMYRHPNVNVDYFDKMVNVKEHITTDHECIILGDLNYNYVLNDNLCTNPIQYLCQLAGFSQLVTEPTRVTMTSSSLIDVILSTTPSSHVQTGVIKLTLSDHYMPYTVLSNSTPRLP